jgi:hypothetical protein
MISLSFCKIEYIGIINATKEAIWLQVFLKQIQPDLDQSLGTIVIYKNNQEAIILVYNNIFHSHIKYFNIKYYFICKKISNNKIEL